MSTLDIILLFWVVPSLASFLLLANTDRVRYNHEIEDYKLGDWISFLFFSCLYPLGILVLFCVVAGPFLIKKR